MWTESREVLKKEFLKPFSGLFPTFLKKSSIMGDLFVK